MDLAINIRSVKNNQVGEINQKNIFFFLYFYCDFILLHREYRILTMETTIDTKMPVKV